VSIAVSDGQSADDHVCVANSLYFEYVELADARIELSVQIAEQRNNLYLCVCV
jgi:hypothetical protein